jgi:hypothetical protein
VSRLACAQASARGQPALNTSTLTTSTVAIIGGGPAGLAAAEAACAQGAQVEVYDATASVGRKFLLAGKGGLNLTHGEALSAFLSRYGAERTQLEAAVRAFDNEAIRAWARGLGIETFVGSSGRVFPLGLKAAPLLRRWLHRLRQSGVRFHTRHRWLGWDADGALRFATSDGEISVRPACVVLALGGASWPALGSDGAWVAPLAARGVSIAALRAANCGFERVWSSHLRERWAGAAVKNVVARCVGRDGVSHSQRGEFMVTAEGVEGSVIYALSRSLREVLERQGSATLIVDLAPDRDEARLAQALAAPRGKHSLAHVLERRAGLNGVKAGLLREVASAADLADSARLAHLIKALPLLFHGTRPLVEAISTAGGISLADLDEHYMLRALPGVFCAGEMLDWEAPTGGYLLSACLATGRVAGAAAARWAAI